MDFLLVTGFADMMPVPRSSCSRPLTEDSSHPTAFRSNGENRLDPKHIWRAPRKVRPTWR